MVDRTPIQLPAGVSRAGSEAEVGSGHWYETNLVRWVGGVLRPIGGWERIYTTLDDDDDTVFAFASKVRKIHTWVLSTNGLKMTAILCEENLYVMTESGVVTDITPTGGIVGVSDSTVGGYGEGPYSAGTYGTPRPDRPVRRTIGPMWSLDNWGDHLLAMASSDTKLLRWKPEDPPGTLASEVVADTGKGTTPRGRFFIVTPERHVMVFQEGANFNRFEWCGQEDIQDWNYASTTSSAGFYDIQPANPFIAACVTRSAIIAFTTRSAYAIIYSGTPYFYTYNFLGYYNAPVTGNALSQSSSGALWYSDDGFWGFDGATISPIKCPLLDYVKQTIDPVWQYFSTQSFYLGGESEIWTFFPSQGQRECDRYVAFNFDEGWWTMGRLSRTTGHPGSAISYPLMSDGVNIFQHEKGNFYYDAPELPYAQTGAINIASGARLCTARQGIVDTRAPANAVEFYVVGRRDRISDGSEIADFEWNRAIRKDGGKLDFRVTGRDLIFRIQAMQNGVPPWSFGQFLCKLFPRGGR